VLSLLSSRQIRCAFKLTNLQGSTQLLIPSNYSRLGNRNSSINSANHPDKITPHNLDLFLCADEKSLVLHNQPVQVQLTGSLPLLWLSTQICHQQMQS
jgi:hypothetical protein